MTDSELSDDEYEDDSDTDGAEQVLEKPTLAYKKGLPKLPTLCQKSFKFKTHSLCGKKTSMQQSLSESNNKVVKAPTPTGGLIGGASGSRKQTKMGIKLINNRSSGTNNICFVNAVVQIFKCTGFTSFLMTDLCPLLSNQPPDHMKGCRALVHLYSEQTARERSAVLVRKCVAQHSGKSYLNDGSQQDAEEFLSSLVAMISTELENYGGFSAVRSNHYGREQIKRVFLDNPSDGSCKKCGQFPSSTTEEFLSLKLTVPESALNVRIESLLEDYFSESTETIRMKCSNCCPHGKDNVVCPQTGFCSRPAALRNYLTKSPEYLFLQLLRFGNGLNGFKVLTLVKFEEEIVFPNGIKYKVLGTLCHRGLTVNAGHFVTYTKSENDNWLLFDDTNIQQCSMNEANNPDNYIILCNKIGEVAGNDIEELVHALESDLVESTVVRPSGDECGILPALCDLNINENIQNLSALCDITTKMSDTSSPPELAVGSLNITDDQLHFPVPSTEPQKKQTDAELEQCISCLENIKDKTKEQKSELKKLKNKRKLRKFRVGLSEEKRVEIRRQDREQHAASLAGLSEEQRVEIRRQDKEKHASVRAGLSEEQRVEIRRQNREQHASVWAGLSKEQREERSKQVWEQFVSFWAGLSEEQKEEKRKHDRQRKKGLSVISRLELFRERVRWGPSYPCITCHQTLYFYQVVEFDEPLENKLKSKSTDSLFLQALHKQEDFYRMVEQDSEGHIFFLSCSSFASSKLFLCKGCKEFLMKGKLPPKAAVNCLKAVDVPDDVVLKSYLEEALVARVLLFIKIFSLRTSLMPAIKDKCIVIPIERKDVINTVQSLPRLPSESGIIDVQWKRTVGQKNCHLQAKVEPDRIFRALQFLKSSGNKHYQSSENRDQYEARCQSDDPNGYRFLFGEELITKKIQLEFIAEGSTEPILELPTYLELLEEEGLDKEFRENDTVRKFQLNYNETVCMVDKFPEAMQTDGVVRPRDFVTENDQVEILSTLCQNKDKSTVNSEDLHITSLEELPAMRHIIINNEEDQLPTLCHTNTTDKENQLHVVAPGEGKTPVSLTYCEEWDAKAFPMLHPDGQNHLSDEKRKRKLSELEYFKQRLFNKDPRWRNNTHWVFAAAVYREKIDFSRNIDLAYKKGKRNSNRAGGTVYTLDDPYSVFQSVANTPAYHKKGKMEMMARLDNFGPFHIFFTLSCADYRWPENVLSVLRERDIGLRCTVNGVQPDSFEVFANGQWITLENYLKNEIDETLHEIIRKNIVSATRNYRHRVQTLMTTIIQNSNNPLSVKHFSSKLEFAGRGAGHNHGVLWLDMNQLEQKVDVLNLDHFISDLPALRHLNIFMPNFSGEDHHLKDPLSLWTSLDKFLTMRGIETDIPIKNKKHLTFRYMKKLSKKLEPTEMEQKLLKDLKMIYPLFGLKSILEKLNNGQEVTEDEMTVIVTFVDTFSTVSLHPAIVGQVVAEIAVIVNQHHHTKTCRKYQTVCRFKFPKMPSYTTIISRPPDKNISADDKKSLEERHAGILKKVQKVLDDDDLMGSILEEYPKASEKNVAQATRGRKQRIDAVLNKAGLNSEEEKQKYNAALEYSSSGYKVVMARDIDELWVNSYNPEITQAWDGNTDFQICLDFYAIITYITEYYCKDDTGVIKVLVNTLKASDCDDLKAKMKLLMNTWIKHRQMGEAEAVFRLAREFRFRDSDATCVFVQTSRKSERSKILKNVTGKPEYKSVPKITVANQEGNEYVEQYDFNSKYDRRPKEELHCLEDISFSQMAKMYISSWGRDSNKNKNLDSEEENEEDSSLQPSLLNSQELPPLRDVNIIKDNPNLPALREIIKDNPKLPALRDIPNSNGTDSTVETETFFDEDDSDDKFSRIMASKWKRGTGPYLPKVFKLKDPFPGEPPFMKLRTRPAVLRFHKFKVDKDPEAYWFSEAILYMPHANEEDLIDKINKAKAGGEETWDTFVKQIMHVKNQVMEYLEDNEEARMMAAEMMIDNALTGEFMDPEGEQEIEDNQQDTNVQCDEFQHLDPDGLEEPAKTFESPFRPIEVRPLQQLRCDARKLDFYQRKVLEVGIRHARAVVKARAGKNPLPSAPLCMVDGAAGAGKSCTINVLQEILQLIMQQTGDDPECPHTLLCAPTGTAAVNIKGQTLHSAFGFSFGNEHYSLSDKTRDTKRATFKNLRFVIIDEVSMVKADQLYQLDLRLRELTMKPNKLFGGVALFFFGDIMQLKPVLGRYIWCQPRSNEYLQAFLVQSHWELFTVISLVENHRQHGDADYADTLNRIRVGEHTEQDISTLQGRVRPEGHSDLKGALVIASKHEVVNHHNERCLADLTSQLVSIEAISGHANIPNFVPKIDKKRKTVANTPFLQTLKVKVGCRVMLTVNIDVRDCLCNGSIGTLRYVIRETKEGEVKILMVEFDSADSGQEMRRCHPILAAKFPRCTPVKKLIHKYSTSGSTKGAKAKAATVQQFPLILSFASTTHKIQGQTIASPSKVAIDLRSVFGPGQAYVMLGRIQELDQLFIIDSLPEKKITVDQEALSQLSIMKNKSVNMNPPIWEKCFKQSCKIMYHNVHSLLDKIEDVRADTLLTFSDMMIFGETWLETNQSSGEPPALCHILNNDNRDFSVLQIQGYELHLNSIGRGKGIATYFKKEKFVVKQDISDEDLQITVSESDNFCIIGLYRSNGDKKLSHYLKEVIPNTGSCIILGDFNICTQRSSNHEAFEILKTLGFKLLTTEASHIDGGHLDQIWLRSENLYYDVKMYSPYYTAKDHDSLLCTLYDPSSVQGRA